MKLVAFGRRFFAIAYCGAFVGICGNLWADQYHYNNVIIGDRALGLGGAYTGVSDDASGVYYNPAGLGFAQSNDISGSANAFYSKKYTYKNTIGNSDYVENSSGSLPSFFGFLQKLDKVAKGLVWGIGVYAIDSELRDQNDIIEDQQFGGAFIKRLHRAQNMRASTFFYTAAAGMRVTSDLSLGFGLSYFAVDELFQDYQDIRMQTPATTANPNGVDSVVVQGVRQYLSAKGIEPSLGLQYAVTPKFALGLTIKKGMYLTQNFEQTTEARTLAFNGADADIIDVAGQKATGQVSGGINNIKEDDVLSSPPLNARMGFAWFASPRLLWTFDTSYYSATKNGKYEIYKKNPVLNYASGLEYYVTPSLPVRVAFFTNNDSRPVVDSNKKNQLDHIDLFGGSFFLAWVQPNSQVSLGLISQMGKGEAQKIGNSTTVQKVTATSNTVAFSASHNF